MEMKGKREEGFKPQPMSGKEKQQEFYKELKELLVKYRAELCLESTPSKMAYGPDEYNMVVDFEWKPDDEFIPQLYIGGLEDGK